jgi:O-antigen ligase
MVVLLAVLTLTGSKGPALAFLIGTALWSMRRGMFTRLMAVGVPLLGLMLVSGNNPLADRIAASDEDLSTLDRLVLLRDSLQQVIDQPWIGSAFVELKSGYYPHNIVLEAAMSFGVPLMLLLIAILVRGLMASWQLLKTESDLAALLYLQGIMSSAIAGAMFGATLTWVSLSLVLGLMRHKRQAKVGKERVQPLGAA